METSEQIDALSPEVDAAARADMQAVIDKLTTGKPLDPETYRRIRERAERITEELRQKHGEMNIAVELTRQTRDEG